jgi:hypothetical protein
MWWSALALACLQGGCGTFLNLSAPPTSAQLMCGPTLPSTCVPFGGTFRAALFGGFYLVAGMGEGVEEFGHGGILKGMGMTGVGLAALLVDTPLSFLGDVVTFPVASARQQGEPWATWWGEQAAPKEVRMPEGSPSSAVSPDGPVTQATARQPRGPTPGAGSGLANAPPPWPH